MTERKRPLMKLLAEAQNAAGDQAVACATVGSHEKAEEWSNLALTIGYCLRDSAKLFAQGAGDEPKPPEQYPFTDSTGRMVQP